ncbi:hypothetical protein ACLOJK_039638 [Asimina triloba]
MNYLRPDIKRGNYSREEEETIVSLHQSLGNRSVLAPSASVGSAQEWSAIAAKLPGRTDNEIKNYWHTYLKKHLNKYDLEPKTKQKRDNNNVREPLQPKPKIPNQEFKDDACADDNFFLGEKVDTTTRHDCSQSSVCTPVDFYANLALESSTLDGYDVTEDFPGTVVDPEQEFQENREQTEIPNDTKEFWFKILMETGKSLEI